MILGFEVDQRGPADFVALLDPDINLAGVEIAVLDQIGGEATVGAGGVPEPNMVRSSNAVFEPAALVAVSVTAVSPQTVGTPESVSPIKLNPAGRFAAV